jgi:hypothetical protein
MVFFLARCSVALEFMPYPVAKISQEQFDTFYKKARERLIHSQRTYRQQHMVVFTDNFNGHHYAFTLPGHAAHPSWIVRRIVNHEGELQVQQVGYYVNKESAFVQLFDAYLKLNEKLKPQLQNQSNLP